ncbi:hypothetical protein CAPTEDRAFT_215274 [Capitella teleta]|uniref:TIR domain-containing protein n=1 Tax=Capitella teleta TaxID=283909 RepID=R7VLB9_CAPTE|nr:hypothetical protein CAPTEDRAFT_215274 [Capitella teleta]|eukprot:ELU17495.1 hypothetical protein CAPTEDRAFT_215274 [Capitella teleta]
METHITHNEAATAEPPRSQNLSSVPVVRRTVQNHGAVPGGSVVNESGITGSNLTQYTTTGHKSLPTQVGQYPMSPPPAYTSGPIDDMETDERPPDHLTEEHYDLAVAFVEQDEIAAKVFIEIMSKYVRYGDNIAPKICIVSKHEGFPWIQSQIKSIGEAVKRSTYVYMIITEDYLADVWADTVTCETVQHTIDDAKRQWCIVPVFLEDRKNLKREIPFGMKSLRGVEVSRMFTSKLNREIKSLADVDVDKLSIGSFDKYFLDGQSKTMNCKAHLRQIREKKQKENLVRWQRETILTQQREKQLQQESERRADEKLRIKLQKMTVNENVDPVQTGTAQISTSGQNIVYNIHNPQNCNIGPHGKVTVNNESEGQVSQFCSEIPVDETEFEIKEAAVNDRSIQDGDQFHANVPSLEISSTVMSVPTSGEGDEQGAAGHTPRTNTKPKSTNVPSTLLS